MLFNFLCISFGFFTPTCLSYTLTVKIQLQQVTCISGVKQKYSNIIISTSRKRPVLTSLLVPGSQSFLIPDSQSFLVHGCPSFLVHGCQSFLVHGSQSFLVHGSQSFLVHGSQSFLGPGSQNFLQLDCLFLHDHRSH